MLVRAQPLRSEHDVSNAQRATGTFEVKLLPLATAHDGEAPPLARMSIDKQFSGDLAGTSAGEMLSAGTAVTGSAGYVAIERVSGTLHGREGTFTLMHTGTMSRGAFQLSIVVIPDSGTGALSGMSGSLQIVIENKQHSYILDYTISASPPA